MTHTCSDCRTKLGFFRGLLNKPRCPACEEKEKEAKAKALAEYEGMLGKLNQPGLDPSQVTTQLPVLATRAGLTGEAIAQMNHLAFQKYLEALLEGDHLDEPAQKRMGEIGASLGITQEIFDRDFETFKPRLVVAMANAGRLPTVPAPRMMLKKDEVAHMEIAAAILKEVVDRQYQGGYAGVSFRIAKGVRFHTGGVRGRSVVVGSHMEAADRGVLTVTSERAIYTGARQSLEMSYKKLLGLNVFNDGVQFHLSNRKKPPLFRMAAGYGHAVAAVVNEASQRLGIAGSARETEW